MHGPIAAAIRSRRAPSPSIAAIVESVTPPSAPFHPACAAPITPASRSANSTGAQSAVRMLEHQAGPVGDQSIGLRAVRIGPRLDHRHRVGAVHLIDADQPPAGQDCFGRQLPVRGDVRGIVAAAQPAVQPGDDACPTLRPRASMKPCGTPASVARADRVEAAHRIARHKSTRINRSSSAWLPTMKVYGPISTKPCRA